VPDVVAEPHERAPGIGVSVVVPVYRSAPGLNELHDRIARALADIEHELVLVDDGSSDATWSVLLLLAEHPNVRAIRLGRNAGQHAALLAGVRAARRSTIVTLDDDLQNPPEEIPRLLAALATSDVDVVYGLGARIAQSWWRRAGSLGIHLLLDRLLAASGAPRATSFRAFRTRLRDGFAADVGPNVSLDALLTWTTDRFTHVEVRHDARAHGSSNYSARRLLRFAIDTVTGYSTRPLRMISTLGFVTSAFGLGILAYVLGRYLVSGTTVAGFPFIASIIAIFSGAQMLSLGVIGEYLARMHVRMLRQPTYVIAEMVGSDDDPEHRA
jgi:glycosyltransferase involved in cell wall biosynthesis